VALSVRILPESDAGLTAAVEETGLGPQEIVEQALELWLHANGYASYGRAESVGSGQ
jgi:hypothetical protein